MTLYLFTWPMIWLITVAAAASWGFIFGARAVYRLNKKLNRHVEDPKSYHYNSEEAEEDLGKESNEKYVV